MIIKKKCDKKKYREILGNKSRKRDVEHIYAIYRNEKF